MLKLVVAIVLCTFVAASPTERQTRDAPTCVDAFQNVPNPCVNNPQDTVYFTHPTDSSKFIQCDNDLMYIIQCPDNGVFSIATVRCSQPVSSTSGALKTGDAPNCVDAFQNVPNPCVNNPQNQVYFTHPTDSSKFIQCDRHGLMYIIQCPDNGVYSIATSQCSQPVSPTSTSTTTTPAVIALGRVGTSSNNPCKQHTGKVYFAAPGDKHSFIECGPLGFPYVLNCVRGLVWDESKLSCVYAFTMPIGPLPIINQGKGDCSRENLAANKMYHAHTDPTKFIQCGLTGDSFILSCPPNLVWNSQTETCASKLL